jgi:hypothetical protein
VSRLVGWWDKAEVTAFLGDDELETPELDVGAQGEADVASSRWGRVHWAEVRCCGHSGSCIHG